MKIRFRRKSIPEWLVLFIYVLPFALSFLIDILHVPSLVKYTADIAWILLFMYLINSRRNLPNPQSKKLAMIVGVFFICTLAGFLLNYQSILYYLWGFRNNARFFVFFFACICYLDKRSVGNYLRFMEVLFWINIPVALFQYFVLGKAQDFLGGIFGVEHGCNGYMNIFFVIIITMSILKYLNREESLRLCLAKCAAALLVSAIAELKAFYVEFVVIVALTMLITKFSFRKLWIIIGSVIGVVVSLEILTMLFPQFADWFMFENMWEIVSSEEGYTSRNDINRVTAVATVVDRFLPTGLNKIFGLGLGNCDYASFDFLVTPFYRAYNELHYMWFSSAFMVLETGFVGLILYIAFFVVVCFSAIKRYKSGQGNRDYCQMVIILAILCPIIIVYNNSMRNEAAYMMYFVLALPFIRNEGTKSSQPRLAGSQTLEEVK